MATISTASAVVTISVPPLFPAPVQIQGFGADDAFDIPAIKSVEVLMGVDGKLSKGFVFVAIPWMFTLMADSASNLIFDTIWTQMQAARDTYDINAVIIIPSIATKFIGTSGALTDYKPAPDGKKLLQARKYEITFESMIPAPV